ncbi:MAG: NAD(+)/NADH kinase [Candidatus Hydrogenedentes bacterium]|nr:NAD(+)/NADH kinase [Candidatus Hydrogenedentota bacterium]
MTNKWWTRSAQHMAMATSGQGTPAELRAMLYGREAAGLASMLEDHPNLHRADTSPDVIICYGGDGTLLGAELEYPGVPKVPIRNSHRGHRCIAHPPSEVISRLAAGTLVPHEYLKLEAKIFRKGTEHEEVALAALNEFNVHMGRINSAVRFKLWIDELPYEDGVEILGDGFVISTPFGSTAYFNQITRGIFTKGIGIAFKYTGEHINHMVLGEQTRLRMAITRGPATLAHDSSPHFFPIEKGDTLTVRKHPKSAIILHCEERQPVAEHF